MGYSVSFIRLYSLNRFRLTLNGISFACELRSGLYGFLGAFIIYFVVLHFSVEMNKVEDDGH